MSCGVEEANDRYERVMVSSAGCVGRLMRDVAATTAAAAAASLISNDGASGSERGSMNEGVSEPVSASASSPAAPAPPATAVSESGHDGISYSVVLNEKTFWRGLLCDMERPSVRKAAYELIAEVHMTDCMYVLYDAE